MLQIDDHVFKQNTSYLIFSSVCLQLIMCEEFYSFISNVRQCVGWQKKELFFLIAPSTEHSFCAQLDSGIIWSYSLWLSCVPFCDPVECNLPDFFSWGQFQDKDCWSGLPHISEDHFLWELNEGCFCIAGGFFVELPWKLFLSK